MDPDGTIVAQPKKYISKILDSFHQMFSGESLPQVKSPLDKNDHPELDNSELDRIPSTTPGEEPPRDAKDSGSARSHSTHLETSSSNRP